MKILSPLCLALALSIPVGNAIAVTPPVANPGTEGKAATDKPGAKARPTLVAGMTGAEIVQAIGKPERIKPMKTEAVAKAEIWFYSYSRVVGTKQVVTGTQPVPQVDTITGAVKNVDEPVYGVETVTLSETTELLMVNDQLVETKRYRTGDRDYH